MLVRKDVFAKWGFPSVVHSTQPRLTLADVLMTGPVVDNLWLNENRFPVTWDADALAADTDGLSPVVVGTILDGGWGCRVYKDMVPATKASAWGPAGRTHLVAQRRGDKWAARTLHHQEVSTIFADTRVDVRVGHGDQGIADFGNSAPARMILPRADGLVQFTTPPSAFVPTNVDQVIAPRSVQLVRGLQALAGDDFAFRVKRD